LLWKSAARGTVTETVVSAITRRQLHRLSFVLVSMSIAATGCGGNGNGGSSTPTGPSSPGSSLTGTWVGTASDSSGPGQMTWQISQSGGSFNGPVTMTDAATKLTGRGSVAGTVSGASIRFSIAVPAGGFDAPYSGCTADVTGEGQVNGNAISGTFQGSSSCSGTIASGQLTLNKQ
jgi:hypothetical protein